MCQHLADNVQRTMQHAIEVEEKIPLDQVRLSVVYLLGSSSMLFSQKFLRVPQLTSHTVTIIVLGSKWSDFFLNSAKLVPANHGDLKVLVICLAVVFGGCLGDQFWWGVWWHCWQVAECEGHTQPSGDAHDLPPGRRRHVPQHHPHQSPTGTCMCVCRLWFKHSKSHIQRFKLAMS